MAGRVGITLVVCLAAPACAGGNGANGSAYGGGLGDQGTTGKPDDPDGGGGPAEAGQEGQDESGGIAEAGAASGGPVNPPDLGSCVDDGDCVIEGSTCFGPLGTCSGGMCSFDPKPAGADCDDGDPCSMDDVCDGAGFCAGEAIECLFENGTGVCVDGSCEDLLCDGGFGDCNGVAADGCETPLDTDTDCGGCGTTCDAGANAVGSCGSDGCEFSCQGNFDNCDGDWSNGCEIPIGANECDATGLNPNGCWTSHCGNSANPEAVNFGTWYCFECTTCHAPSGGMCQWCDHGSGTWYPADACFCGDYEDLACSP